MSDNAKLALTEVMTLLYVAAKNCNNIFNERKRCLYATSVMQNFTVL